MNTLCKIREVSRAIAEFEQRFEQEYHLSINEGVLLCCLARHGELSSGEIAEVLRLTCSNTSKVIRSVERKGFVTRKLGEDDKRQKTRPLQTDDTNFHYRRNEFGSENPKKEGRRISPAFFDG